MGLGPQSLGDQYTEIKDEQGNVTGYRKTGGYGAGMGGAYSAGTAGQIVTPENQQTAFNFQRGITPEVDWQTARYGTYNDMLGAKTGQQYDLSARGSTPMSAAALADRTSSSSSSTSTPGGVGPTLPAWGDKYLQDQLARIREQSSQERDVGMDELVAAGLGSVGGAHASYAGEVQRRQLEAERGAAADNERLAQEYALRAETLRQQALDRAEERSMRASQENTAKWSSLSDAASRLKGGGSSGGTGGGEESGAPAGVTGDVWGAKFSKPSSSQLSSLPSRSAIPLSQMSDKDLSNLMVDHNARQAAGLSYNQVLAERNSRRDQSTASALAAAKEKMGPPTGSQYADDVWKYVPASGGGPGWRNTQTGAFSYGSTHPNA